MDLAAHLFDVSRTTDARVLLAYRNDVLTDDCLDEAEKAEVCRAIEKRFAILNAAAAQPQKPRW